MSDGRRRRRAKQARRDARRMAAYERKPPDNESLVGLIRGALAKGHPLGLLAVASYMLWRAAPDPLASFESPPREPLDIDNVLTSFIRDKRRETTAMLAVLAELMVDDPARQTRCRQELTTRKHALPKWISALPDIQVRRVVRATHVLGDLDQLMIGAQLAGRYDFTCMVRFDHNTMFELDGIDIMSGATDELVASAIERNPDFKFVDMSQADAGAWLRHGLDRPLFPHKSDRWPECLQLVRWLAAHLPDGGKQYQSPEWSPSQLAELFRAFFETPEGAPFDDFECHSMLDELVDSGNGDPLRWSVTRIEQVLDASQFYRDFETPSMLELPDLLRAYIPFAHAQCGIPNALTAEALAFIARKARAYRREVLAEAS
jgi:hypothetical protein